MQEPLGIFLGEMWLCTAPPVVSELGVAEQELELKRPCLVLQQHKAEPSDPHTTRTAPSVRGLLSSRLPSPHLTAPLSYTATQPRPLATKWRPRARSAPPRAHCRNWPGNCASAAAAPPRGTPGVVVWASAAAGQAGASPQRVCAFAEGTDCRVRPLSSALVRHGVEMSSKTGETCFSVPSSSVNFMKSGLESSSPQHYDPFAPVQVYSARVLSYS